jgi:hypothetical protein
VEQELEGILALFDQLVNRLFVPGSCFAKILNVSFVELLELKFLIHKLVYQRKALIYGHVGGQYVTLDVLFVVEAKEFYDDMRRAVSNAKAFDDKVQKYAGAIENMFLQPEDNFHHDLSMLV